MMHPGDLKVIKNQKPEWKNAPDWANSLGIADFDCNYKGEWCWCNGTAPTGFKNIELRPKNKDEIL
jgi:hypothetical protein